MILKVNRTIKHENSVFTQLRLKSITHKLGEKYTIVDRFNDQKIKDVFLVGIDEVKFQELSEFHSYIDENCSLDVYKTIIQSRHYKTENAVYHFLLFSEKFNIKDMNIADPYIFSSMKKEPKKTILKSKPNKNQFELC